MRYYYTNTVILIIFCIQFIGCAKEKSIENGSGSIIFNNDTTACKSCSYIPWCDGSVYVYVDTTASGTNLNTRKLFVLADTIIGGLTYTKSKFGNELMYHRCEQNKTTLLTYYNNNLSGTSSTPFMQRVLQSGLNVNDSWTDQINNNGTALNYLYTIKAKSINRNVLGRNFSDVIHVHETISTNAGTLGNIIGSESDFYYANGVGLIESVAIDGGTGSLILHRVLQQFQIP